MTISSSRPEGARRARPWLTCALVLTLVALLLELQFVMSTTGGTLFVFTTLSPLLVGLAVAILVAVGIAQYRRAHRLFEIERYTEGEVIVREGEFGNCAYFIRSGEVEVVGADGALIAALGAGDHFGEMALLSDRPRNATVRSVSPLEVAVVGKWNFLNMMRLMPEGEQAVLSRVRERVMGTRM